MKALTIREPHISRIVSGRKTIETRTWSTNHRGWIALHSARNVDREQLRSDDTIGPLGHIVAIANLIACRPMRPEDETAACASWFPDLFAWELARVIAIEPTIPARGQLGLWDLPHDLRRQLDNTVNGIADKAVARNDERLTRSQHAMREAFFASGHQPRKRKGLFKK